MEGRITFLTINGNGLLTVPRLPGRVPFDEGALVGLSLRNDALIGLPVDFDLAGDASGVPVMQDDVPVFVYPANGAPPGEKK